MKTESTVKPLKQYEIETVPAIEGSECSVILYENIQGPLEKEDKTDKYYLYDRYVTKTKYYADLERNVSNNFDMWLNKAKSEESEPKELTEIERIQNENAELRAGIDNLNNVVDELLVMSLGGVTNV